MTSGNLTQLILRNSTGAQWLKQMAITTGVAISVMLVAEGLTSFQGLFERAVFAESTSMIIQADKLYRMDGSAAAPGCVLVTDGKIVAVEAEIESDPTVPRLNVPVLMPGFVDAYARISIEGRDAEQALEVAPRFSVLPGIDLFSVNFKEAADEGITTLHVMPGTDSVFAGQSLLIDSFSSGGSARSWKPELFPVVALCRDPTRGNTARSRPDSIYVRQPTNRMGVVWIIRNELQKLSQAGIDPDSPLAWTLQGKTPLLFVSRTEVDINSVLTLANDFGFSPVIFDANEAYRVIDSLAGTDIPVVVRELPTQAQGRSLVGREQTALRWNQMGRLHDAGIPFAIAGGNLLHKARFVVRFGVPESAALESITKKPAEILRIQEEVGSITVGRRANLLALSGDPLSPSSRILTRWIDGNSFSKAR